MIDWFLKKIPTKEDITHSKKYALIRGFLHHTYLWHWHRRPVGRACAIGMIGAFTPWPFQMIQCAILAIIFRAHLPLSVGLVWITNPITIPIFLVMVYQTGAIILDVSLDTSHFQWTYEWFVDNFIDLWRPVLLGCLIHAVFWAVVLQTVVLKIWRTRIIRKRNTRLRKSQ